MRNWSLAERVLRELRISGRRLDATQLVPGLWMGSKPETGHVVSEAGFGLLVLCAEEYQPPASHFPGVKVIHAPFDDSDIRQRPQDEATAAEAARQVAAAMRAGTEVLVTCYAGRNRSGLVCGLALLDHAHDPLWTIRHIQERRPSALTNQSFVDLIMRSGVDYAS